MVIKKIFNNFSEYFNSNYQVCRLEESVSIKEIIYPLRIDILYRYHFIKFYLDNEDKYYSDFESFINLAKKEPYYEWFEKVYLCRWYPELSFPNDKVFKKLVNNFIRLYSEINKNGYNRKYKIELKTADLIKSADSGRKVNNKIFIGNGCHRLACLMTAGYDSIPPDFTKSKKYKTLVPIDNTYLLNK